MATAPLRAESVPTNPLYFTQLPGAPLIFSSTDREKLASFVEVAMAFLDAIDGDTDNEIEDPAGETVPVIDDPDLPPKEDEGDFDLEEVGAEDSFMAHRYGHGAGCEVSDAGGGSADDEGEPDADAQGDVSWTEWNTRGRHKLDEFGSENRTAKGHCQTAVEDDEDDDPDHGLDEGEPNFVKVRGDGAGCPIGDPGGDEHDGREEEHDSESEQMASDVPTLHVFALEPNPFTGKREYLGRSNMMSTFCVGFPGERSADSGALHKGNAPTLGSRPGVPV